MYPFVCNVCDRANTIKVPDHGRFVAAGAIVATLLLGGMTAVRSEDKVEFTMSVKPLLEAACVRCHGPKEAKAHYRLDTRERAVAGGEDSKRTGKPAIVSGKPEESMFIAAIEAVRKDRKTHIEPMPPRKEKRRLSEDEKTLLRQWVVEGAVWPEGVRLTDPEADKGDKGDKGGKHGEEF